MDDTEIIDHTKSENEGTSRLDDTVAPTKIEKKEKKEKKDKKEKKHKKDKKHHHRDRSDSVHDQSSSIFELKQGKATIEESTEKSEISLHEDTHEKKEKKEKKKKKDRFSQLESKSAPSSPPTQRNLPPQPEVVSFKMDQKKVRSANLDDLAKLDFNKLEKSDIKKSDSSSSIPSATSRKRSNTGGVLSLFRKDKEKESFHQDEEASAMSLSKLPIVQIEFNQSNESLDSNGVLSNLRISNDKISSTGALSVVEEHLRLLADQDTNHASYNASMKKERRSSFLVVSGSGSTGSSPRGSGGGMPQRDLIAMEIYTTEESYGRNLDYLINIYYEKLKDVCSDQELKILFSNIHNIRSFSVQLSNDLKTRLSTWNNDSVMGDIFLRFVPFFKLYTIYCNNYEAALECLKSCSKRKDFENTIEREKKNTAGLDFESLLITPVQRIPRYKLLLKELLKHTADNHADKKHITDALAKITDIATTVNDSVKNNQNAKQYEHLLETVKGIGPFLEVHRKFIMEDQMSVAITSEGKEHLKFSSHWILLFTDMIFVATGTAKKRKLVGEITMSSMWVKLLNEPKLENCIEIATPEQPTYYIKISNKDDRHRWLDAISERQKAKADESIRNFKYRFASGGIYDGQWVDGKMHGTGTFTFPNGSVYEGSWDKSKMQGKGKMIFITGEVYSGDWKDGLPHGNGVLMFGNSKYIGEFKIGHMDGKGELFWANGDVYEGEFKNDVMEGQGSFTTSLGIKYVGGWKGGLINGKGKMTYKDGSEYDGPWVNDKRNGIGKMVYGNGDVYNGQWKDNKRHGFANLTIQNGLIRYEGPWIDDYPEGENGTLFIRKSTTKKEDYLKYSGNWKYGKRDGPGELSMNGARYKGNWGNNLREGSGTVQDCTGIYEGQWKADQRSGSGSLFTSKGVKYQGEWKEDAFIKGTSQQKVDERTIQSNFVESRVELGSGFPLGVADLPAPKLLL